MSAGSHPPIADYDLSELREPSEGILWVYRSSVDGFWYIDTDADMALQEATGYPVGELIDYERSGDYQSGEAGELRAVFVGEEAKERIENSFARPPRCPECDHETVVAPRTIDGDMVAVVECRICDYVGEFWPDTVGGDGGR